MTIRAEESIEAYRLELAYTREACDKAEEDASTYRAALEEIASVGVYTGGSFARAKRVAKAALDARPDRANVRRLLEELGRVARGERTELGTADDRCFGDEL